MNLDRFFRKEYHRENYNCSHFVREVWLALTGCDMGDLVLAWNSGKLEQAMRSRHGVQKLDAPVSPCLVIFFAPNAVPHIGIWIEDRVLHITENGVRRDPMDVFVIGYSKWDYYLCR